MEITIIHKEVIKAKIKMDQWEIVKLRPTVNCSLLHSKKVMQMHNRTRKTQELTYLSSFSSVQW
jgi:hypothetical protein